MSVLVSFVCISHRGTSIDNIEVIVEHPNGNPPHIETLTTEKKQHLVKADLGEGGFTYRVCFQSKQAKGQRTRVEVRDKEGITLLPTAVPLDDDLLVQSVAAGVLSPLRRDPHSRSVCVERLLSHRCISVHTW